MLIFHIYKTIQVFFRNSSKIFFGLLHKVPNQLEHARASHSSRLVAGSFKPLCEKGILPWKKETDPIVPPINLTRDNPFLYAKGDPAADTKPLRNH